MNRQLEYKLNLIESRSLAEYKDKAITEIVWDASYDVFFSMHNDLGDSLIEHRLESSQYHPDLDEMMESEALAAIENGLSDFLIELSGKGKLNEVEGMTLNVEFTDNKSGIPTFRIMDETFT